MENLNLIKDGAYFCYCGYLVHISRYSVFLLVVPTNTGIFLCGLNYVEKAEFSKCSLVFKKKIGGNHAFFRDSKALI